MNEQRQQKIWMFLAIGIVVVVGGFIFLAAGLGFIMMMIGNPAP